MNTADRFWRLANFLLKLCLKHGNRRCKPNFWIKLIPLRYTIWVETRLKSFCPSPYWPNDISVAKRVIRLTKGRDWLLCVRRSEVIHYLIEQSKVSTPPSGAQRLPTKLGVQFLARRTLPCSSYSNSCRILNSL